MKTYYVTITACAVIRAEDEEDLEKIVRELPYESARVQDEYEYDPCVEYRYETDEEEKK